MSKVVKKTYGKKYKWDTASSQAFEEARNSTSNGKSPDKLARPSIWAKVPLIETFSPQRTKKKLGPTITLSPQGHTNDSCNGEVFEVKKQQRKRKNEDPFGFGDLDDDLIPAVEYISPKKFKKSQEDRSPSPLKTKAKGVKGKTVKSGEERKSEDKGAKKKIKLGGKSPIKSPSKSPKKAEGLSIKSLIKAKKQLCSEKGEKAKSPKKDASPKKKVSVSKSPKKGASLEKKVKESKSPKKQSSPVKRESKSTKKAISPVKKSNKDIKRPEKLKTHNKKVKDPKVKNVRMSKKLSNGQDSPKKNISLKKGLSSPKKTTSPKKSVPAKKISSPKKKDVENMDKKNTIKAALQKPSSNLESKISNISPKKRKPGTECDSVSPGKNIKHHPEFPSKSPVAKELFAKNDNEFQKEKNEVVDCKPIARKVGRPRKHPLEAAALSDEGIKSESQSQEEESSGPLVIKRKRGRPRKNPVKDVTRSDVDSSSVPPSQEEKTVESQILTSSGGSENTPQTPGSVIPPKVNVLDVGEDSSEIIASPVNESDSVADVSRNNSTSPASGSPFKWFLKNNEKTLSPRKVAQLRRISALPTCTPRADEDNEEEAVPFGLSWGMQNDSDDDNAVRVNKGDKELFTIVRNTKQAQESVEYGESQQFKDDIEYLLGGIEDTNSLSTRCLSLLELASKCSKSAFRMHLRAHGIISVIFQKLKDASSNQNLALCTAAVMFMLTRDRMSIDFDKSILEMMLKLLAIEEDDENCKSKEWTRLSSKLKTLFEKDEIKGIKNLDLSKLTSASLARESFLSLTLQRTGSWFKEEVRLLGGLDHIVDTVVSCSQSLVKKGKEIELGSNARKIERCLKLLENVTVHCSTNQEYVINYRNSALLDGCARLLKYSANFLSTCQEAENWDEVAALWFSAMKILLNLTNDNENTCTKFCQQTDILSILLRSALQLPQYLPQAKQFDVIVLSLGLLLNLVEHSTKNISALNAAVAPACHESSNQDAEKSLNENEDHLAVESLMELFMVRLEAAKDNNGIDEDLSKLNSSLHNSSIRIGPDGVSLVCGDELEGEAATSSKRDSIESAPSGKTSAEREAEHLGKALQRAGKHMEDSLIASYAALLVTLLAENNQENQIAIHEKLANGDFGIMKHTLDKFLAFMNMATTQNNSSSSQIIKRAIKVLEQCKLDHPPRGADAAGSSVET